jgi:hypothetical protein
MGSRPGSAPFVSGDTFRELADHILEKNRVIDPERIKRGEVVFVEAWQLPSFVKCHLPSIREPFVLITHNGDLNIDDSYLELAGDARVIQWFAQNCIIRHPKVTAIPIGLENRIHHTNGVLRDYRRLQRSASPKTMRILHGFTLGTNPGERAPALKALQGASNTDSVVRINSRSYRALLERYGFVASPPGNGVDCHRTWEALYLRVIPVVKRSSLYDSFPGLPVLAVDDWSEIHGWDAMFLTTEYERLSAAIATTPYLRFDYWAGLVERARAASSC